MNILITSAGGPAAVGVIKSLRYIGNHNIVAIDCDELAVGFYLSDKYYVVSRFDEDDFFFEFLEIVEMENIDLILPTGSEIVTISRNIESISSFGAFAFMSEFDAIQMCVDKFAFYEKCKDLFSLPKTSLNHEEIGYPFFAKPRFESGGSRGVKFCQGHYDYRGLDDYEYIYQENLPGEEYTIDVLCDMNSVPLVVIPRKRLQVKAGISVKGEIVRDELIERSCSNICSYLNLKGPICIQMKEDENGIRKFTEINPRFGGGTYFTTLAGVNFCEIIIKLMKTGNANIPNFDTIKVLRYFEEVVI